MIKSIIAFSLASLATFIIPINRYLQGSSYFVVIGVLFLNPSRTIGAMVQAQLYILSGLSIGYAIAKACLYLVIYYQQKQKNILEAHLLALGCLTFVTFILAYIRAKYSTKTPAIGTACTTVHIMMFVTITQMSIERAFDLLPRKIDNILYSIVLGTIISLFCCFLLWPETASFKLRKTLNDLAIKYAEFFRFIPESLIPAILSECSNDRCVSDLEAITNAHSSLLLKIKSQRQESQFEPFSIIQRQSFYFNAIFNQLDQFALSIAALKSSMIFMCNCLNPGFEMYASDLALFKIFIKENGSDLSVLSNFMADISITLSKIFAPNFIPSLSVLNQLKEESEILDSIFQKFQSSMQKTLTNPVYSNQNLRSFIFVFLESCRETQDLILKTENWMDYYLNQGQIMSEKNGKIDIRQSEKVFPGLESNDHFGPFMNIIWKFISNFRAYEFKFALKTALMITAMAIPAFLDSTQEFFYDFRMSWALSSAIVVMTFSVGGTQAAAFYRLLGTFGGAGVAIIAWLIYPDNAIGLFVITFLVSIPGFYMRFNSKYPKFAQIFLVTYSLIVLQKFASSEDPLLDRDYSIYGFALRRGFAVFIGVASGIIVSNCVWPYRASGALRKGISTIYQDTSAILIQLVQIVTHDKEQIYDHIDTLLQLEMNTQEQLSILNSYLGDTVMEAQFNQIFPRKIYSQILESITEILAQCVTIRICICNSEFQKSNNFDTQATHIINIHNTERVNFLCREIVGQILLYLYVLSSAMHSKRPLPPLPDIVDSHNKFKQRLLEVSFNTTDRVMTLMLDNIIQELSKLGDFTRALHGELRIFV